MSLLLDALKRAEQEKHARPPGGAQAATASAPRVIAAVPPPANSLELQPLGGAAGAQAARPDTGPHAAHVVFQAKAAAANQEPRNRTMVWATVGAIAIVLLAASAYVWYSVRALTPQVAAAPRPRAAPVPPPASGAPPRQSVAIATPEPFAVREPERVPLPARAAAPAAIAPEPVAERLARDAATMSTPPPLRMDRSPEAPRQVPAETAAGYEALRQGNLAAARRSYEAALATDPANIDAHLGLATVAARGMNRTAAATHYQRALDLDPRNATAAAGLAALADLSRPDALESQLRSDLERSPAAAALHFTLGNLYAAQSRWHEAQAAFFEAHRLDPGGADIAYNLAVSLDHLGQSRPAADFYRRALDNARGQAAHFDPAAVARRLAEVR